MPEIQYGDAFIKKLENKGYVQKSRDKDDERNFVIRLTQKGERLQDKALCVPESMAKEFHLESEDAVFLYRILYKILDEEKQKNRNIEQ